jgi:hypothetical protein
MIRASAIRAKGASDDSPAIFCNSQHGAQEQQFAILARGVVLARVKDALWPRVWCAFSASRYNVKLIPRASR